MPVLATVLATVVGLLLLPAAPAVAAPCADPQTSTATVVGGFEIDGNLCLNTTGTTGTQEWDTVGGQPVESDPTGGNDTSAWTGGASEGGWPWSLSQTQGTNPAGGSDITNLFAFSQVSNDDVIAYFGWERLSGTGSAGFYVELNQLPNRFGPVPNRTDGDLRLRFIQHGNTLLTLDQAYTWASTGPNSGVWNPISVGGYDAAVNAVPVSNLAGLAPSSLPAGTFAEVAVNISDLFAGTGGCSGQFGTLNLRSVSNIQATDPGLQDWVAPISAGVPSTCPTVVLQKHWVNGADGDTAGLSINGATTMPGFATSTATGEPDVVDTANRATAEVEPGSVVNLAETLGDGNTGTYTSTIGCDDGMLTPPQPGTTGSFTMPADAGAGVTVTCTFTNTRTQTTMTLTKAWATSASGDTADLSIQTERGTTGPTTSTAPSDGPTIMATVLSGEPVTVVEELGDANTSSYDATTDCTNVDDFDPGDFGASFTVPDMPDAIDCTITNTAVPAQLALSKQWVRGAPGDSAQLTVTSPADEDSAVAIVPAGRTGRSTNAATLPIIPGQTVTLSETLPAPDRTNTGTYEPTALTCNGQPVAFTPTGGGATAQFTVPSSQPVGCVYTNTRQQATVILQKQWVNGALGDATNLFVLGGAQSRVVTTSTVTAATGPTFTDEANRAETPVLTGNRVILTERLSEDNLGSYDTTAPTCDHEVVPGADGSFTVTGGLAGATVTCTVTNSRTTGTLRLHKVWRNGVPGDTARLTITGAASPGDNTSTVPRPAPPLFDDTDRPAVAEIFSGQVVTVGEVLGPTNTGSYDSGLACDNGVSGVRSTTFTIGADPGAIACTVTNTARPAPPPPPPSPPLRAPLLRTHTSRDRVAPGTPFFDQIHVRRLVGGAGATATARLYGPFASRAAATCQPRFRVRTTTLRVHNGWNPSPRVRIRTPGVYTWQVTIHASAANRSATHRCGEAVETTVVAKRAYTAPIVNGGFSGYLGSPDLARPASLLIRMPAIGLHAPVRPERVAAGRMILPGDVGEVGWLRKSAGIGDRIGTAVIGGHVSDRHDRPGAMFHLSRAHPGQRIVVTQAGKRYRFRVVSKATFERGRRLPHRFFATTGRHRLVLISCTDRVVLPDGHFHYTRYVVVVAHQVR